MPVVSATASTCITDTAWYTWVDSTSATTGSICASTDGAWYSWVEATGSNSATIDIHLTDAAWYGWTHSVRVIVPGHPEVTAREFTPEERAEQERQREEARQLRERQAAEEARRREEYRVAEEARRKEREAADTKAEALFRDIYGDIEAQRLRERGYFEIVGRSGTVYRLRKGQKIEVLERQNGVDKTMHKLCIHHGFEIPSMDTLVHQALMLATPEGEEELKKRANKHAA